MVDVSRRLFLGGAIALTSAVVLPASASELTLYGDGEHDDTAALQALLRREEVRIGSLYVTDYERGILRGGTFKISHPIIFDERVHGWTLTDGCIAASPDFKGRAALIFVPRYDVDEALTLHGESL